MIFSFNIVYCLCVLVIHTNFSVLKLQRWFSIILCHLVLANRQMKKPSEFTTNHGKGWVSFSICLSHCISICQCIVYHKALKVYNWHTILCHDGIQILLKQCLCHTIFRLPVTTCNHHHLTISVILNMTCHCRPILRTVNVVEHYLQILHVSFDMHALYK